MMTRSARIPTVAIGLPVYNGAAFLRETLDAILAQDFTDFEVVIGDNASTDGTEAICREFAARDPRIVYHRHAANLGAAPNYNFVFEMSRAPLFKWAAHDDLLKPGFLSACVAGFDRPGPRPALVYPRSEFIDAAGHFTHADTDPTFTGGRTAARRCFDIARSLNMVSAVFGVFDRAVLEQTRLIGAFIASDYALLVETAYRGPIVRVDGPALFQRRLHPKTSREANVSDADVLRWFSPNARGSRLSARQRLYVEYVRGVMRHRDRPLGERVVGTASTLAGVAEKRARVTVGRWRRAMWPAGFAKPA